MKHLIVALFAVAFLAGTAVAGDVVKYEAKNGAVTFDHKAHQAKVGDCAKCHEGAPAKIAVDKDYAHKNCKGCHQEKGGPTKCGDCHKK